MNSRQMTTTAESEERYPPALESRTNSGILGSALWHNENYRLQHVHFQVLVILPESEPEARFLNIMMTPFS